MFGRRSFLLKGTSAAAFASAAALAGRSTAAEGGPATAPYIEILTFRLHFGEQNNRLLGWLEKHAVPMLQKHRIGPAGFFTVEVGPHVPAVVEILTYPSLTEMEAAWGRVHADKDWGAAIAELESSGPPFFRLDTVLLRATDFCPPLKATPPEDAGNKIYELRFYEASTHRQLEFMHGRFAAGEIDVFHKTGINPILYADTVFGPNIPNMGYLIPFESEAQREKAWAAFRVSPEWSKIAEEWTARSGELARNISNTILAPTAFSALR
ncbi:MAG TPA: NIPSNAP family protein [Terriglobia bacterium]|nr:NIPSNAP family protein [Terriglobia bacterium]